MGNASHIELVIFDLDGTLVDSSRDISNALNYALQSIGLPARTENEIVQLIGNGTRTLVHNALALNGKEAHFLEAFAAFSRFYREHLLDHTRTYPGVEQVLNNLDPTAIAVLSNKRQAFCDPIIDGLNLRKHFQVVRGGDQLPVKKPNPEPIEWILQHLHVVPEHAIMVGDSPIDIEAGKRAGTYTIGLLGGFCKPNDVKEAKPNLLLDTVGDLCSFDLPSGIPFHS